MRSPTPLDTFWSRRSQTPFARRRTEDRQGEEDLAHAGPAHPADGVEEVSQTGCQGPTSHDRGAAESATIALGGESWKATGRQDIDLGWKRLFGAPRSAAAHRALATEPASMPLARDSLCPRLQLLWVRRYFPSHHILLDPWYPIESVYKTLATSESVEAEESMVRTFRHMSVADVQRALNNLIASVEGSDDVAVKNLLARNRRPDTPGPKKFFAIVSYKIEAGDKRGGRWRSQGGSNPCYRRERPVSWTTRRWERAPFGERRTILE
jgi:hypothetical protein